MQPGKAVIYALVVMTIAFFGFGLCLSTGIMTKTWYGILLTVLTVLISLFSLLFIAAHQQNRTALAFKVRFVPVIPAVSLLINIIMMLNLAPITWVRLVIWMAIGMAIYLLYGIRHSVEERPMGARFTKNTSYASVDGDDSPHVAVGTIGKGSQVNAQSDTPKDHMNASYINPAISLERIDSP